MRFVAIKSKDQQAIQCVHRIRQRLVKNRTALANQIRGFLGEYGIVIPQGIHHVRANLIPLLDLHKDILTPIIIRSLKELYEEMVLLDEKIKAKDLEMVEICKENDVCKRLMTIRGVGPITASALVSTIGDISVFKNGRELAAWLGLVPRQHSSGNKQVLLGITKRGDKYLRSLLIHGARAGISRNSNLSELEENLIKRRGIQKAYVAFANKNARIAWAIMAKGTEYEPDYRKTA
jgi:transposase